MHPLKKILFTLFGALLLLCFSPLLLLLAVIIFPAEWIGRLLEKRSFRRSAYPAPYKPGITRTTLYRVFCALPSEQKSTAAIISPWELSLPGDSPRSILAPEATCVFIPEEAVEDAIVWQRGDWIAENSDVMPPERINLSARIRELENNGVVAYVFIASSAKIEGDLPPHFFRFAKGNFLPPIFLETKDR